MSKGRIPAELIEKIRGSVNILDIVREHVNLRKGGSNYTGCCPFHSERTPSFGVSEQKQLYFCYGCHEGGDVFRFLMKIQDMSFIEAVEELADRGRVSLPKDWGRPEGESEDPEVAKRRAAERERTQTLYKLNRFVSVFYERQLASSPHIDQYFRSRGVEGEIAKSFHVGAAPASWDALASHLQSAQAPFPLAHELGLVRPSQKGGRPGGPGYFDLFRNRAMFPVIDARGKVTGFGGRLLPLPPGAPDVAGADSPKYMNSPESKLYQKDKQIFGIFQAQKHIREKKEVIIVEGYFDVLGLHVAGFQNAVAVCGTALSPDHLSLFKKLDSKVIMLFDGDKAGVAATERAMMTGLAHGVVLYGASMPEGLDPDQVVLDEQGRPNPDGIAKMTALLSAAVPLLDDRIAAEISLARSGPEESRANAIKKIGGWLSHFSDPIGRDLRLESVPAQLGVSKELLLRAMGANPADRRNQPQVRPPAGHPAAGSGGGPNGGFRSDQRRPARPERPRPSARAVPFSRRDQILLAGYLLFEERFVAQFSWARANLPPETPFSHLLTYPAARSFCEEMERAEGGIEHFRREPAAALPTDLDGQVRTTLMEAAMATGPAFGEEDVRLALGRALGQAWARFSQRIKEAMAAAEAKKDAGLQEQRMKEYLDVQRKMKEFSSFYDEA